MLEKNIQNDKAVIKIYSDKVEKKYFESERNLSEYVLLQKLQSVFVPFQLDGWLYDFVKILDKKNDGTIVMDRALGSSIDENKIFKDFLFYHAGVWLGNFHNLSKKSTIKFIHGDFSLSNIMVADEAKKITVIDPESSFNRDNYYIDIVHFFVSIVLYSIKKKSLSFNERMEHFIKGYKKVGFCTFDSVLFNQAVHTVMIKRRRPSIIKKHGRVKFYIGYYFLFFYLKVVLKIKLKKHSSYV